MDNNIFNSTRFVNYLIKYTTENKRILLINLALIIGLPIVLVTVMPYLIGKYDYDSTPGIDNMWGEEITMFSFIFVIWAATFGSRVFSSMSAKGNRIDTLTNPASYLEKFATYMLIYVVIFYIVYIGATFLADIMRVWIARMYAPKDAYIAPIPLEYVLTLGNVDNGYDRMGLGAWRNYLPGLLLVNSILNTQAFFTLGGIVWSKNAVLKTFGCALALNFIMSMAWIWGMNIFIGSDHGIMPRFDFDITTQQFAWIFGSIGILTTILTYWLAYARFRESEIIDRW